MFIFVVMFFWGAVVYVDAYRAPDESTRIYCVGKQWMWKFQHPEGQREINMLHVPTGRPIQILFTSEDVIHSFFVPEFRVHMDVLPNRYTSVWFQATRPGNVSPLLFAILRHEPCGHDRHGRRDGAGGVRELARVARRRVDGPRRAQGAVEISLRELSQRDRKCPRPVLEGLYRRQVHLTTGQTVIADDAYIRESILSPGAKIVAGWENIMPTFRGQISEEEIYLAHRLFPFAQARRNAASRRGLSAADGDSANQPCLTKAIPSSPKTPAP